MSERLFKKGEKVRAKVRTMMGWKGEGLVAEDQLYEDQGVKVRKLDIAPWDSAFPDDDIAEFMSDQVARCKK